MTRFFDDLEAQLHAAARAQLASRRARPQRRSPARSIARSLPVLLAIGTSVVIAALALVLLRHNKPVIPTHPPAGAPTSGPPTFPRLSPLQRKQIDYVMTANGTTARRDRSCAPLPPGIGGPGRKPSLSKGTPNASTLAIIGTLRRPQTTSDKLPPRKIWHGPHSSPRTYPYGTYPPVQGIYIRYIRYARHRDGANYYLVPAENVNEQAPVPARCYSEQVSALHQELSQIPRHLRPGIFALQNTYLAYQRRSTHPYPGVCLGALNSTGNGDGFQCYAISQISAGHTLSTGAPSGVPVVYGLAPDGVHSVTFYYRGPYPGHPLTAPVISNVYILHDPRDRLPGDGFPTKLTWRTANGQVIKTITWP
jgi:hypothetical protein